MPRTLWTFLLFVGGGFAVYATSLDAYFLSDDWVTLLGIDQRGPFGVWSWHTRPGGFWRPLVSLSWWFDYQVYGLWAPGFHITNVALHVVCSFLVYRIARRAFAAALQGAQEGPALGAGVLFLVLPCHSEAVTWISGRTDVVSSVFSLAAFLFYLRHHDSGRKRDLRLSLIALMFGLAGKEAALGLFPVVWIHLWMHRDAPRRGRIALAYAGLVVLYFVLRRIAVGVFIGGYGTDVHAGFRLWSMWGFVRHGFLRALLPPVPPALKVVVHVLVLVGAVWLGRRLYKMLGRLPAAERPPLVRSLAWAASAFVLAMAPVITLGLAPPDTRGERLLYLPSAFFVLAAALAIRILIGRARPTAWALAGLSVAYTVSLVIVNDNWRQAGAITRSVVRQVVASDPPRRLVAIIMPDSYRGAYVFRNGFRHALKLLHPELGVEEAKVIAAIYLRTGDEPVELVVDGLRVRVTLPDPETAVLGGNLHFWNKGVGNFLKSDKRGFVFELDPPYRDVDVYYWTAGRIVRLKR